MINTLPLRHAAFAGAAMLFGLQSALATETPTTQDLVHATASGSYLAARHAGTERDSATAAAYYLNVLKSDPRNAELLSRAFLSVLTEGDIEEAGRLADRLVQVDRSDRIARLVLSVRALKQKQYALARQNFAQSIRGPVTDLTATLLTAWAYAGAGDSHAAIDTLDRLSGPDWYSIFKDMHAALILDLANNKKDAAKRYERAYKADAVAVRNVEAYGRFLSRNGNKDEAVKIYSEFEKTVPNHPVIVEEAKQVAAGEKLPLLVDSAQAGAAEVSAARLIHPVETLEDTNLILFCYAEAIVAHADERFSFTLLGGEGHGASGGMGVLEGVVEKNIDDAAQRLGIAENRQFRVEDSLAEIKTTHAGDGAPAGGDFLQGSAQVHRLDVELLAAGVGAGQGK